PSLWNVWRADDGARPDGRQAPRREIRRRHHVHRRRHGRGGAVRNLLNRATNGAMFHTFISAFTTLFVAIGPAELAAMFLALTPGVDSRTKRRLALVAAGVAAGVLLTFALGGLQLLSLIGVGLPAFRTAGGVLLLMTSAEMLLSRHTGLTSIT